MQVLSKRLMEAVLATLKAEPDLVEKCFAGGEDTSMCRLNFYPACPNPETNLGVGPHSDPGILTVLLQDDSITSLQVEKNGKFYDIPPVPSKHSISFLQACHLKFYAVISRFICGKYWRHGASLVKRQVQRSSP